MNGSILPTNLLFKHENLLLKRMRESNNRIEQGYFKTIKKLCAIYGSPNNLDEDSRTITYGYAVWSIDNPEQFFFTEDLATALKEYEALTPIK